MKLPAVILIKILKCFEYVIFLFQSIQVHCGRYELCIINGPISINVSLFGELEKKKKSHVSRRTATVISTKTCMNISFKTEKRVSNAVLGQLLPAKSALCSQTECKKKEKSRRCTYRLHYLSNF